MWVRMKLKNLFLLRNRSRLVRQFGGARLMKLSNGQHELIGGSNRDRSAAYEWASLFAHEIVFTHFHRDTPTPTRKSWTLPTLQIA